MKLIALQKLTIVASITFLLTSCSDQTENQNPQRFRLKKTVGSAINADPTYEPPTSVYTYNANGKLATQIRSTSSLAGVVTRIQTSTFTYDGQNRLTRIDNQFTPETGSLSRYTFTYDANGNIETQTSAEDLDKPHVGNYKVISKQTFTYNGSSFPATMNSEQGKEEYTYSNGNLVKLVFTPKNSSELPSTRGYLFDDKPNPYYGLISPYGLSSSSYSKNNIIDYEPKAVAKRTYSYNSQGLVAQDSIRIPYSNTILLTTYEYEFY